MLAATEPQIEPQAVPSQHVNVSLPTHLRRIVLTGFMGAGKTTSGRLLAERLGWDFLDVDALIEQRHSSTIAGLFNTHGETAFRLFESSAIAHALGRNHVVIALGGGAVEGLTNRLLLEQTPGTAIVFLDAPFKALIDRCLTQPDAAVRPVLADQEAAALRFQHRLPLYKRVATLTIATEGHTAKETVQQITKNLAEIGVKR